MNKSEYLEDYSHVFMEEEILHTYHFIAADILPRLYAFLSYEKHYHSPHVANMPEWNRIIQKMIDSFELLSQNKPYTDDEVPVIKDGLDLFREHFVHLYC